MADPENVRVSYDAGALKMLQDAAEELTPLYGGGEKTRGALAAAVARHTDGFLEGIRLRVLALTVLAGAQPTGANIDSAAEALALLGETLAALSVKVEP